MGEYWWRVSKRAFSEAAAFFLDSWWHIVIGAIGIILALIGLYYLGSPDAFRDESIVRVALAVAAILPIPLFFLLKLVSLPASMEKDATSAANTRHDALAVRVEDLERRLKPSMRFEYNDTDNKFLETTTVYLNGGRVREYQIGRVAIRNTSEAESVENVEITLIHYMIDGSDVYKTIDKKLMANSIAEPIVDLHASRAENFNLFRIRDKPNRAHIELGPFVDSSYQQVPLGKYRIKVTASGKGSPPIQSFTHAPQPNAFPFI